MMPIFFRALLIAISAPVLALHSVRAGAESTVDYVRIFPPIVTSQEDMQVIVSLNHGPFVGTKGHTVVGSVITINIIQNGLRTEYPPHFYATEDIGKLAAGSYTVRVNVDPDDPDLDMYMAEFPVTVLAQPDPSAVAAVEFYNSSLDHYFMTASAAEIAILDSMQIPGWRRTNQQFHVNAGPVVGTVPVCRYYIPPALGDSHFFSAFLSECTPLYNSVRYLGSPFHSYVEETLSAFYVALPDSSGDCAAGRIPVYRLWNQRQDSNHRYTTSSQIRSDMIAKGYVSEGYGPAGVGMCALP